MKIILLKDIKGVGKRFEEKEVSNGYAANFLIPRKLATSISGASAATVKTLKEQEEKARQKKVETFAENISKTAGAILEVKMRANEQGHLFEKITVEKVSEILNKELGIMIDPEQISLENPIKELGSFEIPVGPTHFTLEVKRA
ncbi:MAG: 50S ribosomal protein L9 [Candidatus Zambryskibacteria bacterium]|nr:50S ribosomal protein L9 [Candidatus Zambryskibacteria bacterium]